MLKAEKLIQSEREKSHLTFEINTVIIIKEHCNGLIKYVENNVNLKDKKVRERFKAINIQSALYTSCLATQTKVSKESLCAATQGLEHRSTTQWQELKSSIELLIESQPGAHH